MTPSTTFTPIVSVVDFHHARYDSRAVKAVAIFADKARGPEVERWFGVENGSDPALENDWNFLPFMALTDGAHAYVLFHWQLQGKEESLKAWGMLD